MSSERLQRWALLAEVIGGIAVVISLVFVGVQMRANTRATKSATANAANTATSAWYTAIGNDSESSALFYRFMTDIESLTTEERFQIVMNLHGVLLASQNAYYLVKEGTLDQELQNTIAAPIHAVKHLPGWKYFWDTRKSMFQPAFQKYVDELMTSDEAISQNLYDSAELPEEPDAK